ncbi:MAG TPA: Gfo/Idh/MocA family oxidoreductase [Roseiarcus sp.]|jgi:predicted dehydrogenase|nr:Gfo/Idh/MocA family oxidoreductase [Roseiarcus sp.]
MTVGVGVIGAGIVSELYAQAIERGAPARFVGVYDPDRARSEALARRLGGRPFDSRDALLADREVEACLILSPNHAHVDDALTCLGVHKHVLVEKPIAETHEAVEALAQAARRSARVCMPAHNYIYNPSLQRARRLLEEKRFGTVASYWILYNIFHAEEVAKHYGGVLREVAVHHAYSLLYLAGRPLNVSARTSRVHYETLEAEDQVALCCEMPGGALANLWVSFAASDPTSDPWTVVYKILGEKGGVSFTWNDAIFADAGGPAWGVVNYVDSFHDQLTHFLDSVIPGRAAPLSTLQDAADALAIVAAAESSVENHGAAVPIDYRALR